jgi:hypothetical protein
MPLIFQEGVFTVVFGLATAFIVPRSVQTFSLLTDREREVYTQILIEDWSGDEAMGEHSFTWAEVWSTFSAPHVLLSCPPLLLAGVLVSSPFRFIFRV